MPPLLAPPLALCAMCLVLMLDPPSALAGPGPDHTHSARRGRRRLQWRAPRGRRPAPGARDPLPHQPPARQARAATDRANRRLARAAERYARSMSRRNFFAHRSTGGSTPVSRARRAGYRPHTLGETSPTAAVISALRPGSSSSCGLPAAPQHRPRGARARPRRRRGARSPAARHARRRQVAAEFARR